MNQNCCHTFYEFIEVQKLRICSIHASLSNVFLRILQRECDAFVVLWNFCRTRSLNNLELPNGIPNHIFSFPEQYGRTQKDMKVTVEFLQELST